MSAQEAAQQIFSKNINPEQLQGIGVSQVQPNAVPLANLGLEAEAVSAH